jgi:hypothetical protein
MTTEYVSGLALCMAQAVSKYVNISRKEAPLTASNEETVMDRLKSSPLNSAPAGSHLDTCDVTTASLSGDLGRFPAGRSQAVSTNQ